MSTIFRDLHQKPIEPDFCSDCRTVCKVCGGNANAFWIGQEDISICYTCAVSVLPALIADAMRARGRDKNLYFRTRERMICRFNECAALAMTMDPPDPEFEKLKEKHLDEERMFEVNRELNGREP